MSEAGNVPDYESMLAAYHAAFSGELRAMVAGLPIREGDRVLDLACGDGAYSGWLSEHVGDDGVVLAVDISADYLALARRSTRDAAGVGRIRFVVGGLERLPFAEDTFDLAWCAQSLFSLPDPVEAVRQMRRVVRPGGVVAVLENDTLHQVLLPWPIEVELAARRAELVRFAKVSKRPRKFYVGRNLLELFLAAGLEDCRRRTWANDRQAPLGAAERAFLREYLRGVFDRAAPHLEPDMLAELDRLVDPASDDRMIDWPHLAMTTIDHVVWGVKPAPGR